jgi:hypothetical protein
MMKPLYDEIVRRFPEIEQSISCDAELPYLVVGGLVHWLVRLARRGIPTDVIDRVVDFDRWCVAQPPGETAEDDIPTIESVALREKLFEHDELLPIIPRLMSREELLRNRTFLAQRIGAERYAAVMRLARDS